MWFWKNSFFRIYHTSHLFLRRCAAHCRSCKIAIFTHHIFFLHFRILFAYSVSVLLTTYLFSSDQWQTWYEWLKPFFSTDRFAPYTLLAVLNREQLLDLLQSGEGQSEALTLPMDGILACVRHHILEDTRVRCYEFIRFDSVSFKII